METLAPPEPSPIVVRDVHPAEVTTPGGVYRQARAIITRARLYVWVAEGSGARLVLSEAIDPERTTFAAPSAPRNRAHHVTLSGQQEATVHIIRARGCGCGSPLKAFQPWTPYVQGPM